MLRNWTGEPVLVDTRGQTLNHSPLPLRSLLKNNCCEKWKKKKKWVDVRWAKRKRFLWENIGHLTLTTKVATKINRLSPSCVKRLFDIPKHPDMSRNREWMLICTVKYNETSDFTTQSYAHFSFFLGKAKLSGPKHLRRQQNMTVCLLKMWTSISAFGLEIWFTLEGAKVRK